MSDPKIHGQNPPTGYFNVKFRESEYGQTLKNKQINIPIGTKISTAHRAYEVKSDGIYNSDGIKLNDIPLSSEQFAALDAIDINDDNTINREDLSLFSDKSLAKEVNKELKANNSNYHVPIVEDSDGGFEMAAADPAGNFSVEFAHNEVDGYNQTLDIELPKLIGSPAPSVPSKTIPEVKDNVPAPQIEEPKQSWWKFW